MGRRCDCYVLDVFTHRKRKCKLTSRFYYKQNYCFLHAKKWLTNYAIIIQKYYARYRVNKKLDNLFFPLPRDLQRRVLFYIREPYLLQKYHYDPIENIVINKMKLLMKIPFFTFFMNNEVSSIQENIMLTSFTEKLRLFTKYYTILDNDMIEKVNETVRHLYFRHISRSDINYNTWTNFYDVLSKYYFKSVENDTDNKIIPQNMIFSFPY